MTKINVKRKNWDASEAYTSLVTAAVKVAFIRGTEFGIDNWLYPGDELLVYVSTNNAGDTATAVIHRRVLRVGDDF